MKKNPNHAMKVIFAILVSAVCLSLCDETNAQNRTNGHDDERYRENQVMVRIWNRSGERDNL